MDNVDIKKTIYNLGTPFEIELFELVKKYPDVRCCNVQKNKRTGTTKMIVRYYDEKKEGR